MAVTQADIDSLRSARNSGVATVEIDGKRVTYRTQAEIDAALLRMETELQAQSGARRTRRFLVYAVKGY